MALDAVVAVVGNLAFVLSYPRFRLGYWEIAVVIFAG
jgi:hypothetical protein